MKQLLFFLMGFSLIVFPVNYVYALECANTPVSLDPALQTWIDNLPNTYFDTIDFKGFYDYETDWDNRWTIVPYLNAAYTDNHSETEYATAWVASRYRAINGHMYYAIFLKDGCPANVVLDTDNDGLPDSCDYYPDDPTPYSVRLLSYQEDSVGVVRQCYQTDRKDLYCIGEDYNSTLPDVITVGSAWQLSSDICTGETIGEQSAPNEGETEIGTSEYNSSTQSGQPSDANDSSMGSGESSDGTETNAEQKIIDNTAMTADNVARVGDYLNEINASLKNLDYTVSVDFANRVAQEEIGSGGTEEEVATGSASAGNVDSEYSEAQTQINTNNSLLLDAPLDYQEKTDIVSRLNDYIDDNPVTDLLNDSGVQISGAVSSVSYQYNGQSISLSVDKFDDEMEAFGAILVGIATLSGIVGLFRG